MEIVKEENVPKIFRELLTIENFKKNDNSFSYYFENENHEGYFLKFILRCMKNIKIMEFQFHLIVIL